QPPYVDVRVRNSADRKTGILSPLDDCDYLPTSLLVSVAVTVYASYQDFDEHISPLRDIAEIAAERAERSSTTSDSVSFEDLGLSLFSTHHALDERTDERQMTSVFNEESDSHPPKSPRTTRSLNGVRSSSSAASTSSRMKRGPGSKGSEVVEPLLR